MKYVLLIAMSAILTGGVTFGQGSGLYFYPDTIPRCYTAVEGDKGEGDVMYMLNNCDSTFSPRWETLEITDSLKTIKRLVEMWRYYADRSIKLSNENYRLRSLIANRKE